MVRAAACLVVVAGCATYEEHVVIVDVSSARGVPEGDADPRALTEFDDVLAGYGVWLEDETFGQVWRPADDAFVPYATNGHFVDLDGELIWVSELPWGAAALHHGRWLHHDGRWLWVAGRKYSGAWVTWTHDGTRTSWAPAPPTLVWKRGVAVRIMPPIQPIVGTSDDPL